VVLSFAFISLGVLLLGMVTNQATTMALFCVYRSPFTDILTYPRFFLHVLGHSSWSHYFNNMLMLLVVGPPLEEKYGSKKLLLAMVITAFISGAVQFAFFPSTALLGASGIVFMMIVLLSMTDMSRGKIPLTLILVLIFYVGSEVVSGITVTDNVSQLTHVIGGATGAVIGFVLNKRR
jgi:membrane associated rhomboid family serine protease